MTPLAQVVAGYSLGSLLILAVILAACYGLVLIACRQFGVQFPPWVAQVIGIVVVAFVVIMAIRLVLGM